MLIGHRDVLNEKDIFPLKKKQKNNMKWEEWLIHLMLYLVQKSRCCNLEHLHSHLCCWLLPDIQVWLWYTKELSYGCQLLWEHLISLANYRDLRLILTEDNQQLGYSNLREVILVYIIATTETPRKMRPYSLTEPLEKWVCTLSVLSELVRQCSVLVELLSITGKNEK